MRFSVAPTKLSRKHLQITLLGMTTLYWSSCVWGLNRFNPVRLFATLWTIACQVPLFMGFSRQEYWSGEPCPSPGSLPNPGIKPASLPSPELAGRFCTTSATWVEKHRARMSHVLAAEQELIPGVPADADNQARRLFLLPEGPLRGSNLLGGWNCPPNQLLMPLTHSSCLCSPHSLLATHLGSSGPFTLMTHLDLYRQLWPQNFLKRNLSLSGSKQSSCQERIFLAQAKPQFTPSSLRGGTNWTATIQLAQSFQAK